MLRQPVEMQYRAAPSRRPRLTFCVLGSGKELVTSGQKDPCFGTVLAAVQLSKMIECVSSPLLKVGGGSVTYLVRFPQATWWTTPMVAERMVRYTRERVGWGSTQKKHAPAPCDVVSARNLSAITVIFTSGWIAAIR
jgi:hypothetical protein